MFSLRPNRVALAFLLLAAPLPSLAADWTIDPAKSTLGFTGRQTGALFSGRFAQWGGQISFDPADPAHGSARIEIDMASAATGDLQKDSALPGSDWFDIGHFPKAVFTASSFRSTGGKGYVAVGSLSLRGVAKPVELPFTLEIGADGKAHAKGELHLRRTDYGVGQGSWAAADTVALEVSVTVDVVATPKP